MAEDINVDKWAAAVEAFERGDRGDKARNMRNFNPGNLKFNGQPGVVGIDDKGFAIFGSREEGMGALKAQLALMKHRNPDWSLEQHMHHYLGGTGEPKATEEGDPIAYAKFIRNYQGGIQEAPQGKPKTWWEVAQSFDPLMPADQYNMLKKMYFDKVVVPQIPEGFSHTATWKQFDEATQREHHLDAVGRFFAPMMEASEGYAEQIAAPLKLFGDQGAAAYEYMKKTFDKAHKLRAYEGVDHPILKGGGELTGGIVSFVGVGKAAGAMGLNEAIPLAADFGLTGDAAALFDRVMRGGTSFATYEAAVANKEDRGVAALKGFGAGAAFEGGFALASKLLRHGVEAKNVQKILQLAFSPGKNLDPALDQTVADTVVSDVAAAKSEGRTSLVQESTGVSTPLVRVKTHKGDVVEFDLAKGEKTTLAKVQFHLQQGGEVVGIEYPPGHENVVNSFLRAQEKEVEGAYQQRTVKVTPGQEAAVSAHMQVEGVKAAPAGEGRVAVSTPRTNPTRDQVKEHLARQGVVEPELTNMASQVMQLWNKDLPEKSALTMLDVLKAKVKPEQLNAMLPERWKLPEQTIQTALGDKTPSVIDAIKELGGDPVVEAAGRQFSRKARVNQLYTLLDLPNADSSYVRGKIDDTLLELGITHLDAEDLMMAPVKSAEELDAFLRAEEAAQSLEEEVVSKSRDIEAPGAMEEAARKGEIEFQPYSKTSFFNTGRVGEDIAVRQDRPDLAELEAELQEQIKENKRISDLAGGQIGQASTRIPNSERAEIGFQPGDVRPRLISSTPARIGIKVTPQEMEEIFPGAAALTAYPNEESYRTIFNKLGITELNPAEQRPLHLYSDALNRSHVWHENLHVGLNHASGFVKYEEGGLYDRWVSAGEAEAMQGKTNSKHWTTAHEIMQRLRSFPAYGSLSSGAMLEEAFVHAATAVRMGDAEYLGQLASWDTSVRHVLDMVEDFGVKAVDMSKEQIDSYPVRIFQRAVNAAIRKASVEQLWELRVAEEGLDSMPFYDPTLDRWNFVDAEGNKVKGFKDAGGIVDHLERTGGDAFAPSVSLPLEMRGVRGPMVPRGGQPSKNLPLPTLGLPEKESWVGWKAISGAFKPMLSWVAEVDTKMNEVFSSRGQHFPIWEKVKAVDEALSNSDDWRYNQLDSASQFLKGSPKKLYDYMDVLTVESKYWPQMQVKYHLSDDDMKNIAAAEKWLQAFQDDTHIPAFNYLRDQLPRLRGANFNTERIYGGRAKETSDMSFFHRAISEETLNPRDAHLGRFINFLIREGAEKKFTGSAINDLKKLVDLKARDGSYILGQMRWPLANYVNYVRGIPDTTQQVITRAAADFQKGLGRQFERLNKFLPDWAQLPTEFNYPGNFVNRLLTLSYVGSLGARPAIALRDSIQAFTTSLPVLGERFALGASGITPEGLDRAMRDGALLKNVNIGELYPDIFLEMPAGGNVMDKATKLANKLLSPSRWGHNIARSVAYNAEYESTLKAVSAFREGRIDAHDLLTQTSMWWYDQPAMNRLLRMAVDQGVPVEEVAKLSGRELVDTTLWPYRRGAQPAMLRTGLGRIFGQYGMWPLNYMDFLSRGIKKFHQFPTQALRTSAIWAGSNYAAVSAMNAAGADVGKWFWVSPAGYGGSPQLETIQALGKSFEETDEGRQSREKLLQTPLTFLPAYSEMRSVVKAVNDGGPMFNPNGSPSDNFLRVLGFKPLNELHEEHMQSLTPEEKLEYELGLKKVR